MKNGQNPWHDTMTRSTDTLRRIRKVSTITVFFTLIGVTYEFVDVGQISIWGPAIGFMLGIVFGSFEAFFFANRLDTYPFFTTIAVKTFTYVVVITIIFMSTGFVAGYLQGLNMDDFVVEITSRAFWGRIGVIFTIFLAVVFFLERTRLEAENERKRIELEKADELKHAYDSLEEAHQNLKSIQSQLIQSEKMASLGRLTAGIAHEIQNPLNFVNNFAQLNVELADELEEELEEGLDKQKAEMNEGIGELLSDLRENAQRISEHGHRAENIVKGMIEHFRTQPGLRRLVNVNDLLEEYVNLSYHGFRAKESEFNVVIDREYDAEMDEIELGPREIGRVFLNLLDNAFYVTREKALALNESYTPNIIVRTQRFDDAVEICIEDNGTGIDEAAKSKLFEPFFTTKPAGEGTGLGLSLSYDIVTHGHGGSIQVDTEEGKGAVFRVRLPAESTMANA